MANDQELESNMFPMKDCDKNFTTFCVATEVNLSRQNVITFSYVFRGRMILVYVWYICDLECFQSNEYKKFISFSVVIAINLQHKM